MKIYFSMYSGLTKVLLLLFSCIVMVSCSNTNSGIDIGKLSHFLDNKIGNNNLVALIIPETGCSGCMSKAEDFIRNIDEAKREKIFVVYTRISDRKLTKNRIYSMTDGNFDNIHFDTTNDLYDTGYKAIYPLIIYLNKKHIERFEYFSVEQPQSLSNLEDVIDEM
ncbi:MAG: hypothetical protein AAGI49_07925 [Bacteroidota bacterium]